MSHIYIFGNADIKHGQQTTITNLNFPERNISNRLLEMAGVLFEDIFDVKDIDPEGKKFDRGKKYLFIIFLISCVIWH